MIELVYGICNMTEVLCDICTCFMFQTCENAGHEFDVIEIAYDICNMKQPMVLDWLDKNWKPRVQMVRNRVKEEGQKIDQNDIGEISEEESESTLKDARGDVEEAVKKCIQTRTAMVGYNNIRPFLFYIESLYFLHMNEINLTKN